MARPIIDLTGQRFGSLSVVAFDRSQKAQTYWRVRCDCGAVKIQQSSKLRGGIATSCGCQRLREPGRPATHGHGSITKGLSPEYRSWISMRRRCNSPRNRSFPRYGGRGITVCDRWRHDFPAFLADMGAKPTPAHTIERIDSNGNYEPGNCRWATMREQQNNRGNTTRLTAYGVTMPLADWARAVNVDRRTLRSRIFQLGHTPERALGLYVAGV